MEGETIEQNMWHLFLSVWELCKQNPVPIFRQYSPKWDSCEKMCVIFLLVRVDKTDLFPLHICKYNLCLQLISSWRVQIRMQVSQSSRKFGADVHCHLCRKIPASCVHKRQTRSPVTIYHKLLIKHCYGTRFFPLLETFFNFQTRVIGWLVCSHLILCQSCLLV